MTSRLRALLLVPLVAMALAAVPAGASGVQAAEPGAAPTTAASGPVTVVAPDPAGVTSTSKTVSDVACRAVGQCVAVGGLTRSDGVRSPLLERFDGTSWTASLLPPLRPPYPTMRGGGLSHVDCGGPDLCVAVGEMSTSGPGSATVPIVETWDGTGWTASSPTLPADAAPQQAYATLLSAVSCASASTCTAVGDYTTSTGQRSWAVSYAGGSWTSTALPVPPRAFRTTVRGLDCAAPGRCVAVGSADLGVQGSRALLARHTPSGWRSSYADLPSGTSGFLKAVSCAVAAGCHAVGTLSIPAGGGSQGYRDHGLAAFVQGRPTRTVTAPPQPAGRAFGTLDSVSCWTRTDCLAVGVVGTERSDDDVDGGRLVDLSGEGPAARTVSPNVSGPIGGYTDVACRGSGVCLAVSDAEPQDNPGLITVVRNGAATSIRCPRPAGGALTPNLLATAVDPAGGGVAVGIPIQSNAPLLVGGITVS